VQAGREQFGWLGALTGPARDLDVYVIEWPDYVGPLGDEVAAALEPVRQVLERRLDAAYAELAEALASPRASGIRQGWPATLADLGSVRPQGRRAGRPLGREVRARLVRAQDRLLGAARAIGPETPAEHLHDLRKDAKRLRYLIECFGSILPGGPRTQFVKRLKAFQANLGTHQDAEVHVAALHGIALDLHQQGAPVEAVIAIGQLTERLEHVRITARAEFAARFADYDTAKAHRAFEAMLDGIER
jgi:CHAD domain-containing protein